jgi:hypothetical protein
LVEAQGAIWQGASRGTKEAKSIRQYFDFEATTPISGFTNLVGAGFDFAQPPSVWNGLELWM